MGSCSSRSYFPGFGSCFMIKLSNMYHIILISHIIRFTSQQERFQDKHCK